MIATEMIENNPLLEFDNIHFQNYTKHIYLKMLKITASKIIQMNKFY